MELLVVALILFPLYFLFRWVSTKYIQTESHRTIFLTIAIPFSAILIYAALIFGVLFFITYSPKREFNRTTWMNEKNIRYQIADDLIKSKLLINSDTNKVKRILGEPVSRDSSNTKWGYNLGTGGGGLGFLFHFLDIKYENNKVINVQHIEYRD